MLARTGDALDAVDLFLVDVDAEGVTLEQQRSMAYDTQYKVTFAGVTVPAANRLQGAGRFGTKYFRSAASCRRPLRWAVHNRHWI